MGVKAGRVSTQVVFSGILTFQKNITHAECKDKEQIDYKSVSYGKRKEPLCFRPFVLS
jgi:hypothetical protein